MIESYKQSTPVKIADNSASRLLPPSNDVTADWVIKQTTGVDSARNLLEGYPYTDTNLEVSIGEEEQMRKRFVETTVALEDLQPGLGAKIWCSSKNLNKLTRMRASHVALDIVYSGPDSKLETSDISQTLADLGLVLPNNAKGPRNRKRRVEEEAAEVIASFPKNNGNELNFLSVAAGSGRAMMEAIAKSGMSDRINFLMVDQSRRAKTDGEALAQNLGIKKCDFKQCDACTPDSYLSGEPRFHMIEVVGLLDYFTYEQCVPLLKALRENLVPGGKLLYSNIAPNDEKDWLERVVRWIPMDYKTAADLQNMAIEAGFSMDKIRPIGEPTKIYNLIAATK